MKLVGYLRVSTEEQVRTGGGLDIQRAQIAAWAKANGHQIVAWASDEGVSGSIIDRPGILDVYAALDVAGTDGVVAQADTRFGRSLAAQEAFFASVWKQGRRVFTVQVGEILEDDPDDPMRTAMRKMRGIMSELEAGMIRKRLRDGRRHAKELGQPIGGQAPFGWRSLDKEYVEAQREQAVLELIKHMRFDEGRSLYDITQTLNRMGVKGRRGGPFTITILKRLLPPGVHPSQREFHPNWLQPEKNGEVNAQA